MQKVKDLMQKPLLLLLFGAVLTALILVFPILGALQWISMIPIFIGVYRLFESPLLKFKKAYLYGFLTVYVYYFILYHWFVSLYPLDFVGLEPVAAIGAGRGDRRGCHCLAGTPSVAGDPRRFDLCVLSFDSQERCL